MLYSCSSNWGKYCDSLKQWNLLVDYLTKSSIRKEAETASNELPSVCEGFIPYFEKTEANKHGIWQTPMPCNMYNQNIDIRANHARSLKSPGN